MTRAELRLYFLAWIESRDEVERLASLEPSPAVDQALARAEANADYDRCNYLRMRAQYRQGGSDLSEPLADAGPAGIPSL
jgi:hypothetical protein